MCVLSNVFCFDKALMLWSICYFTGIKYTYIKYSLCLALFLARVKSHKSIVIQPLAAFLCYATLFSHALMVSERGHHPTQRGPSVPLTWSIPMCRAASGSELSKWNFTAANKSPWHRAASARAWHSSDEGRPHCRGKRGVDTVSLSANEKQKAGRSELPPETSHSPFHATGWSLWHFLDRTNTVWPAGRGCRGSFAAGRLRGPWR